MYKHWRVDATGHTRRASAYNYNLLTLEVERTLVLR